MTLFFNALKPNLCNIREIYWKIFSIKEIESDIAVRLFGAAVLIGFLVTFKSWEGNFATSILARDSGSTLCWPAFQGCADWFFMTARPHGYTQNIIFMVMLELIFLATYGLLAKKYTLAHICILLLFLWKLYITSINYRYNANYDYYQTLFTFVFLFLPHKRFFGSLTVVFFYFLSTAVKIHESWTLGTYFTAMKTGLPIFPKEWTIILTNFLIFMEMIAAWFLFSKNKFLQRSIFIFFVIFHFYSGALVGYHYPVIVSPSLIIFFGPLFKPFKHVPNGLKSIPGWSLILALLCLQMVSHIIPGDEKLTLEGNFYGLYMFESNHQCSIRAYDENQKVIFTQDSTIARNRCDPYRYWFRLKERYCTPYNTSKYSLKMTHSINGGPFYLIVNEPDICTLEYKPFSHNDWIKTEKEAKPTARPRQNYYR